jgi:hypothetical protein
VRDDDHENDDRCGAQARPDEATGEAERPQDERMTTPMTSVTRSAMTMGAVRATGTACVSKRTRDLKTSPTLPGVTVRTKPLRNVSRLSTRPTPRMRKRAR